VLVDQLQAAGYVHRVPDPTDGRARLITFTELGERACAVANGTVATVEARWAEHLGPEAMAGLRHVLSRLREITDPYG
jgi:DNA-binding MarR family transcriptional regulator